MGGEFRTEFNSDVTHLVVETGMYRLSRKYFFSVFGFMKKHD